MHSLCVTFREADNVNRFDLLISYAALGLLARLEPGMENGDDSKQEKMMDVSTAQPPLPKGKGRIIRDETGKVIGIDLAEDTRSDVEEREEVIGVTPKTNVVRGRCACYSMGANMLMNR